MDEEDDGGTGEQLQRLNASLDDDNNGIFSPTIHPGRLFLTFQTSGSLLGDDTMITSLY